jgi:hypothetical protein
MSRIYSGNACSYTVEINLSYSVLKKRKDQNIYKTIILRVVSYGHETWSLTLGKHVLSVSETSVLRRICGPRWTKGQETEEKFIMSTFVLCIFTKCC